MKIPSLEVLKSLPTLGYRLQIPRNSHAALLPWPFALDCEIGLPDRRILDAFATRVFVITSVRTLPSELQMDWQLGTFAGLDAAKDGVERRRKKGSAWVIEEYPAAAFVADDVALVATQCGCDEPLKDAAMPPERPLTCALIQSAFYRRSGDHTFAVDPKLLARCSEGSLCRRFVSDTCGGNYYLGWTETRCERSEAGVFAVVRAVREAFSGDA